MRAKLKDRDGYLNFLEIEDFEYVDPFEKMGEIYINAGGWMERNINQLRGKGALPEEEAVKRGQLQGYEEFVEHLKKVGRRGTLAELYTLLTLKKKSRQQDALKGLQLTDDMLMHFIYDVCKNHGCTYSMYSGRVLPKGVNVEDIPAMAALEDDGSVEVYGNTTMLDGQVKNLITQQKSVFARFIDKSQDNWHCFVYTMKGIGGKEIEQGPHIHYLSNRWGIKREELVARIKAGDYPNTGNHIPYQRYT